jgi:ribosomal protein S18 acetylase RimI-like enzyme
MVNGRAPLLVRELSPREIEAAADLTARGMRDNPLNLAAFGADPVQREARLRRMFRLVLPRTCSEGWMLGAFERSTLVAIAAGLPSTKCQPRAVEKLRMARPMLFAVGAGGFLNLLRWTGAWAAHDLSEAHWHLGPVAVDSHLQGMGIGSALVAETCARFDRANAVGYLETDKLENVSFYRRLGFETVGEARVLNTRNWFMRRPVNQATSV